MRENCIRQSLSHLDPKNSIYTSKRSAPLATLRPLNPASQPAPTYLRLQQTALEQHQRLPLELPNQLPQTHPQILLPIVIRPTRPLLLQRLLEPPQDLGIGEIPLREPRRGHDAQPLAQHAERLRRVGNHHDGFLHRRARHVGGPRAQRRGVHLLRAGDAEEGGGGLGGARGPQEREVGEILGGAGRGAGRSAWFSFFSVS